MFFLQHVILLRDVQIYGALSQTETCCHVITTVHPMDRSTIQPMPLSFPTCALYFQVNNINLGLFRRHDPRLPNHHGVPSRPR